jgi:hypothetical protein
MREIEQEIEQEIIQRTGDEPASWIHLASFPAVSTTTPQRTM